MEYAPSAFDRLRALLHDIPAPPELTVVPLQLGESRLELPDLDVTGLADPAGWARYPQLGGTPELRAAYTGWLERRFGAGAALADGRLAVEPTPGSKQAVAAALTQAAGRSRDAGPPAVIMPNPCYPTYLAAAQAAGVRPVYYTIDDTDDASPIAAAVADAGGSAAAIVLCNPGNPRGEIISAGALRDVAKHAAAAGAVLLIDECYTDLALDTDPPGFLSLVADRTVEPGPFLVLHSLSKRSGAPGLRSGFVAGDPATVTRYARYNRTCGVPTPLPVCAAAAALWSDDTRVRQTRRALARNWAAADEIVGTLPGYRRPAAGFFLWLPVPDDEAAARRLWREQALVVMPGRYLAADGPDGVNPGAGHLRIALVHDGALTRQALRRLRDGLLGPF